MKLISVFLAAFFLFSGCTDKSREKSQDFDTPAGSVSISVISTRHYDAGITGAPHAPIVIPYIDKHIFNAVQISLKGSDSLVVDDLAELTDLLSKDQIDSILGQIFVTSSPDGKNIVYRRKQGNGNKLMIVHRFDDGTLFYSGIYEEKYRESIDANKNFDWKIIPSVNEIAKQILLDTISDDVRDAVFENALINQKHPSELDNFALDNFGGPNLGTTYIEVLSTDSFWKKSNPDWDKKVRSRISVLNSVIEKSGKNFENDLVARPSLESLLTLEHQANAVLIADQIDSMLVRMSFVSEYVNTVLSDRIKNSLVISLSDNVSQYLHNLSMQKINSAQANPGKTIQLANYLSDSTLVLACAKKLLTSWPEMAADTLNPNPLDAYYSDLPVDFQKQMRMKAEKYIDTQYFDVVKDILMADADCEHLKALCKKYPAKFEGQRMPCDSAVIYQQ